MNPKRSKQDIDELMGMLEREHGIDLRRCPSAPYIPVTTTKHRRIDNLYPHYTNELFRKEQTVYLLAGHKVSNGWVNGAEYVYDDRVRQWNWEGADQAWKLARLVVEDHYTAACHEAYLQLYYKSLNIELVHILSGVNWSNGYPYMVYGFITHPVVAAESEASDDR